MDRSLCPFCGVRLVVTLGRTPDAGSPCTHLHPQGRMRRGGIWDARGDGTAHIVYKMMNGEYCEYSILEGEVVISGDEGGIEDFLNSLPDILFTG